MRRTTTAIPVLTLTVLTALVLLAAACNRRSSAQPEAGQVAREPIAVSSPEIATPPAKTPAVDTEAQEVAAAARAALEEEARLRELARREQEAAAREAALAERERRLERERRRLAALDAAAPSAEAGPEPAPAGDPAPALEPAPPLVAAAAPGPPAPPEVTIREIPVTVPAGTVLDIEFLQALSSESNRAGDEFRARTLQTIEIDGYFAIPAGSEIAGVVTEAEALKKIGGRARLALHFDRLVLPSGEIVPIRATFAEKGSNETRRDAAAIGGGAAAGAILGRVAKPRDKREGGLIGSILGAAVGAAVASRTQGEPVVIESGERTSLELQNDVRMVVKIRQIRS